MSILLCYDGSPSAQNAIRAAQQTLQRDDVTLLHVWNEPLELLADSFSDAQSGSGPSQATLEKLSVGRAQEIADQGQALATRYGVEAETRIATNILSEWQTILAVADELDSSMIVVGAHPRGTPGPRLDSVSQALVEHSKRPVLVVPMGAGS